MENPKKSLENNRGSKRKTYGRFRQKREKMPVTNIFSFSTKVFYPLKNTQI